MKCTEGFRLFVMTLVRGLWSSPITTDPPGVRSRNWLDGTWKGTTPSTQKGPQGPTADNAWQSNKQAMVWKKVPVDNCVRAHTWGRASSYKNVRLFESSEEHNDLCYSHVERLEPLRLLEQTPVVGKGASLLGKIHMMDHLEFVRRSTEPFDLNAKC